MVIVFTRSFVVKSSEIPKFISLCWLSKQFCGQSPTKIGVSDASIVQKPTYITRKSQMFTTWSCKDESVKSHFTSSTCVLFISLYILHTHYSLHNNFCRILHEFFRSCVFNQQSSIYNII